MHDAPWRYGPRRPPGMVGALRWRLPLLAYTISLGIAAAYLAISHAPGPVFVAPFVALVLLISRSQTWVWALAAVLGAALLSVVHGASSGWSPLIAVFAAIWVLGAIAVGLAFRARRRFMHEMRTRARLEQRSRQDEERRRLAEERLRIAREMHDVVGHSLAVISLQAGVAEHLLESRPDEARKAVAAIRGVSRQALGELRVELAALRGDGAQAAERAPTPTLRAIPTLVERMRDAGVPVELSMDGDVASVPDITAAAAYRIVQESLTNVARHAGAGARATVRVVHEQSTVSVEVTDDGPGAASVDGDGIAGMRDRATTLGGTFTAGNGPSGGFRVWASLPVSPR